MVKVKIDDNHNRIINGIIGKFVKKTYSGYYMGNRGGGGAKKIKDDNFLGKKGEVLVRKYLIHHGYPRDVLVDMKVYGRGEKSWDADLPYGRIEGYQDVHVKSCSLFTHNYCNDYSWTFQWSNGNGVGGKDKLFNLKDSLIGLVYMERGLDAEGIVFGLYKWEDIISVLRDPRKESLKGIKKCLYGKDLFGINKVI